MLSVLRHPGAAIRRHVKTRTRGQSLVELALILPVFMLFFAAVLDLGRVAAAQVALQNAAREGAFQAAKTPTDFNSSSGCPANGLTNVIYCRIKLESSGGVTISPTDVSVACNPVDCSTGIGNTVTVRVSGHFRLLTPLMAAFFSGNQNIVFTASSVQNLQTIPASGLHSPAPTATPTPTPTGTAVATPTATATPTLPPTCILPSAGFTYVVTGSPSHSAPQTIWVTDTSTSINCGITSWIWNWGDGTTGSGQVPGSHTYVASNAAKAYTVTLSVTNAAGANTTGGVQIQVK
jgi:PKD repeat protein